MNLREAFLAASRPAPKQLPKIDGIEADVYVRQLTVGQILEQQEDMKDGANRPAVARAFARVVCNADGSLVYDSKSDDDVNEILQLGWTQVKAIMEHANKLNGVAVDKDAVEKN